MGIKDSDQSRKVNLGKVARHGKITADSLDLSALLVLIACYGYIRH